MPTRSVVARDPVDRVPRPFDSTPSNGPTVIFEFSFVARADVEGYRRASRHSLRRPRAGATMSRSIAPSGAPPPSRWRVEPPARSGRRLAAPRASATLRPSPSARLLGAAVVVARLLLLARRGRVLLRAGVPRAPPRSPRAGRRAPRAVSETTGGGDAPGPGAAAPSSSSSSPPRDRDRARPPPPSPSSSSSDGAPLPCSPAPSPAPSAASASA